ncbi:MAG: hypothetical protein L6Q57_07590 [Alphaproteobacteria bacterium]|nr:hypothetical protein [Alphaproteobacteria bacterium]
MSEQSFHQKLALERAQQSLSQLCAILAHAPENTSPLYEPIRDRLIGLVVQMGRDLCFLEQTIEGQ